MEVLIFLVTAAVAVAAAITMVLQRNAMYSALFLVLNFFCLAVLYVLLQAYFVAVVQVAVYAGAIMVLMLFVIMLLNVAQPEPRDNRLGFLRPFGVIAAVVLAIELGAVIARGAMPPAAPAGAGAGAA
ncbi:MAG TPA: NADH-quinone oxidoreductase subunit J, partial [Chloroflexota bacterium]|nr:NADH-quinone oxidoreductase subunit J [Chloroflexota bacterium]